MKMRATSRGEDKKLHDNNNLKKQPLQFMEMEKEFFKNAEEKHLSPNLTNYVFKQLICTQRGYGFRQLNRKILDPESGNILEKKFLNCGNSLRALSTNLSQ